MIEAIENVSRFPLQKVVVPLIAPGVEGVDNVVTASVDADEVPQLLPAVTDTVPPLAPTVELIEVVLDVPVQPFGRDHV